MVTGQNPRKEAKISSHLAKVSQDREIVQNWILTCYCGITKQLFKWSVFFIVHLKIHNGGSSGNKDFSKVFLMLLNIFIAWKEPVSLKL